MDRLVPPAWWISMGKKIFLREISEGLSIWEILFKKNNSYALFHITCVIPYNVYLRIRTSLDNFLVMSFNSKDLYKSCVTGLVINQDNFSQIPSKTSEDHRAMEFDIPQRYTQTCNTNQFIIDKKFHKEKISNLIWKIITLWNLYDLLVQKKKKVKNIT